MSILNNTGPKFDQIREYLKERGITLGEMLASTCGRADVDISLAFEYNHFIHTMNFASFVFWDEDGAVYVAVCILDYINNLNKKEDKNNAHI